MTDSYEDVQTRELSEPISEACSRFFQEQLRLKQLIQFVPTLFEEVKTATTDYLITLFEHGASDDEAKAAAASHARAIASLRMYGMYNPFVQEMFLCRSTDNFLSYLTDILTEIFLAKPEALRSSKTVKLEDVLRYKTMQDFVQAVTEDEVNRLAYLGIEELSRDIFNRVGFDLFPREDNLEKARVIIEIRNIVVHNRGIVNRTFYKKVGEGHGALGDRVKIASDYLNSVIDFWSTRVINIELRSAEKFGFPRTVTSATEIADAYFREARLRGWSDGAITADSDVIFPSERRTHSTEHSPRLPE